MNACVTVVWLEFTVLKKYPSAFSADHSILAVSPAFSYDPPNPAASFSTCSRSPVPVYWISTLAVASKIGADPSRRIAFALVK